MKRGIKYFGFTLLLFIQTSWNPVSAQDISKNVNHVLNEYKKKIIDFGVVGSSLYIIHNGKLIGEQYVGLQNKDSKTAIDKNSIYHWASITKTFTGIAIMQLRDKGLLKLTDPVIKYLPELREVYNPFGSMDSITIWHLMTHTAGFRSGTWPWLEKDWQPYSPQYWSQLVAMLPYTNIEFKPGSKWQYSNPGTVFLGRIIEIISKDDYEYYIDKNILKPLGMFSSYFDKTPPHLLQHLNQSYWIDSAKNLKPAIFDLNTGITVSNGGLSAPLTDMLKYVNFLLGNADASAYKNVLSNETLGEMFTRQHKVVEEKPAGSDAEWQCLKFFSEDIYGMQPLGHSGWQNAFQTHLYFDPKNNIAYLVAYNTAGRGARGLDDVVKELVLKNIFLPLQKK